MIHKMIRYRVTRYRCGCAERHAVSITLPKWCCVHKQPVRVTAIEETEECRVDNGARS